MWMLEIHHLDIGQGDATLIIARNLGLGMNQEEQVRSVLIDGGRGGAASTIHQYITTPEPGGPGLKTLDVMVVTHYDMDHMNGITGLIKQGGPTYKNALIYDQGEQGVVTTSGKYKKTSRGRELVVEFSAREKAYDTYARAAVSRRMRRVTRRVLLQAENDLKEKTLLKGGWHEYDWLLGKDVMWSDEEGKPVTPGSLLGQSDDVNANPPTVKCIAANRHVLGRGGPYGSGNPVDPKNEKSLAFLVRFNNFKYYIGGDIETTQEEVMMEGLNHGDTLDERVLAMKLSHHGSNRSTSDAFLERLKPVAAFISCGIDNPHDHPDTRVLKRLEAAPTLKKYYMTEDRSKAAYDERVGYIVDDDRKNANGQNVRGYRSVHYSLKGHVAGGRGAPFFYGVNPPPRYHGDLAPHRMPGHVLLYLFEEESRRPVANAEGTRFYVQYYEADALHAEKVSDDF